MSVDKNATALRELCLNHNPTDLTSEQWELLSSLIPLSNQGCRLSCVDIRAVMNAIFYILCAGCADAHIATRLPLQGKRYITNYRSGRMDGTWERMNHKLQQWVRVVEDREPLPLRSNSRLSICREWNNGIAGCWF